MTAPVLSRALRGSGARDAAPVGIVHVGLGAFHRAHQAWYTDRVDAEREWGIAAFTGRTPAAAQALSEQGGIFTLVERSATGDRFEVVSSISRAIDGARLDQFVALCAAESIAVITLTVTEAAYLLTAQGRLDLPIAAVQRDLHELSPLGNGGSLEGCAPATLPGRLVLALEARRRAGGAPLAVVSCDNLSANGSLTRRVVLDLAEQLSDPLAEWIRGSVSFVETSIDRITPRTVDADTEAVLTNCGWIDNSVTVTEPFHDWVLSGEFPRGRPRWEEAGARFVDTIEPYENRKLWLLNGAHSLLAYAGLNRGYSTVFEALSDESCSQLVESFWDEAARHLPEELGIGAYRQALRDRFGNFRIAHSLHQVAMEGTNKLRMRVLPVYLSERAAGQEGGASAHIIAEWLRYLGSQDDVTDAQLREAGVLDITAEVRAEKALQLLSPELAVDSTFLSLIASVAP